VVGSLVLVASLLSSSGPSAFVWALAAVAGVALPTFLIFREQRRAIQDTRDLWGLQGLMTDGKTWPSPGGWALGAGALKLLIDDIDRFGHRNVVELGPGASSIVLGHAEPELRIFGLEHDEKFVELVTAQLERHRIDGYELIYAPLETADGEQWYSRASLARLPDRIDVLIVDGPPNWQGKGKRRPAWKELVRRIEPGGLVLVDDTHRHDERTMATDWLRDPRIELILDAGDFMALRVTAPPT
jgi:predicted O-methyltransferase YrrM